MTFGQLGRADEAKAILGSMPPFTNLHWFQTRFIHYKREQDREHMIDGLRKGGMPEFAFGFEGDEQDRLDSEALEKLSVGKAWSGVDSRGMPFTQQISTDGRIAFSGDSTLLAGTVWIEQGKLCVKYRSNLLGRNDCGYVFGNKSGSRTQQNEYVWVASGAVYYFSVDE
jgi:adenylate cyclase